MPEHVVLQLWELIPSLIYFVLGMALFGVSILLMAKFCPFSIRKEIEEDQNISLGIIMGAALIGISIILAAIVG
ncbi:MAG: DUF350 domain-containing protein [Planctomycetota bacterium]